MRTEHAIVEGDLTLDTLLVLHGHATDSIFVCSGGRLDLYGSCAGDVVVEPGGEATVIGQVSGKLINAGGTLHVCGTVVGGLYTEQGHTTVDHQARIFPTEKR